MAGSMPARLSIIIIGAPDRRRAMKMVTRAATRLRLRSAAMRATKAAAPTAAETRPGSSGASGLCGKRNKNGRIWHRRERARRGAGNVRRRAEAAIDRPVMAEEVKRRRKLTKSAASAYNLPWPQAVDDMSVTTARSGYAMSCATCAY